jgi:excisionase family DNA binding protein
MASDAEVPKLLLSTREVARALGVSERFVKGLIHTGSLRSLRVGRLRRVYADDLRDWIERQRAADRPIGPEAHR